MTKPRRVGLRPGFTFVEVLAAMMFLAIVIPAVISALTVSNRAAVVAERSTMAGQLAENKLSELTLGNAWSSSETRGDFGQDWQGYRWELTQSAWKVSSMVELTMTVFFQVQGQEHTVRLS